MKKEDTDLIGEAIDFYNLNHFKGKETKKRLVKLKDELKQFVIPVVSNTEGKLLCEDCNKVDRYLVFRVCEPCLIKGKYIAK
jgi:hypothetical protein